MTRYRKKPVEVEARQITDGNAASEIADWCGGSWAAHEPVTNELALYIPTLEGNMRAGRGDWVIRGVAGEFYPCKAEIFAATYEPVDAAYDTIPGPEVYTRDLPPITDVPLPECRCIEAADGAGFTITDSAECSIHAGDAL